MDDPLPSNIKGYEIRDRIGSGGFGAVYRAYQSAVGREVAIKVILPGMANKPEFIRRFETEAQLIAKLEHMHIVPLYDYWRDPQGAYLVMRYLRGGSLADALKKGPYDLESASLLLDQICSALTAAHRSNVVHRDIKPDNILLDEDSNAYLVDFGIAKDLELADGKATEAGAITGSLDYLAPEQALGEEITAKTDIYSLGIVLYEMLTGEHPYAEVTSVERLYYHINNPLPQVELNGAADQETIENINQVIQNATVKKPELRYENASVFAAAFREAAGLSASQADASLVELLTPREREVLNYLIEGNSNREIAGNLAIELATVKWYLNRIYRKLNVRSRAQAIVRARELNLIADGFETAGTTAAVLPEPLNPYKGLSAFTAADTQDFFGRERLIKKLLDKMKSDHKLSRFLAVVGPSGSGKSSLVKAGLVPALWRGEIKELENSFIAELTPGAHPIDKLEVALLRLSPEQGLNLAEQLSRDGNGLVRAAGLILPDDGSELLVVIDQFEEVFTLLEDEEQREHLLDLIYQAVTDKSSRVRVVVTLRADFYDRPLRYPKFGELIQNRIEVVLPLGVQELELAITKPAERVGVYFEEGLVATIIGDVSYQPGALPLLQYALTELFEKRQERTLTLEGYEEIGRAGGALAGRAEEIYAEFSGEARESIRQMFLRLVTLGEGVEDTRRRVYRHELLALTDNKDSMEEIIDTYTEYRMLALDNDPATRQSTVEVAHEALLREWERLRVWLDESRDDVRLQRLLGAALIEWLESEKDPGFLLRGSRLTQFVGWATETDLALTEDERAFLEVSLAEKRVREAAEAERQAHEAELERRSRNRLRAMVGIFAVAAVIAVALSIFAFDRQAVAQENAALAIEGQATATVAQGEAIFQAGTAEAERARAEDEAQARATQQALAEEETLARATAQAVAEAEAVARATQQTLAEEQKEIAVEQARVATSRELSQAANINLDKDPELSIMLALQALDTAFTRDAENVLHTAVQSSRARMTLSGHTNAVKHVTYSPDGSQIASKSDDGTVRIWDAATGNELLSIPSPNIFQRIVYHPSGSRLAGEGAVPGEIAIWDTNTGEEILRWIGHDRDITDFEYSPDGNLLATTSLDDTVRVWNAFTGEELHQIPIISGPFGENIIFSRDGKYIIYGAVGQDFFVYDLSSSQVAAEVPEGGTVITLHPDGDLLIAHHVSSAHLTHFFSLSDLVQGRADAPFQSTTLQAGLNVAFAKFSPDGKRYLTIPLERLIPQVWQVTEDGLDFEMELVGHTGAVWDTAFHPDGNFAATAGDDGLIKIFDLSLRGTEEIYSIQIGSFLWGIELNPDGTLLTIGGVTTKVIDPDSGEVLFELPSNGVPVYGMVFSPDGSRLVTAYANHTAVVWDIQTRTELFTLVGHEEALPLLGNPIFPGYMSAAYSPDGTLIATCGEDGTVRLWDAATGEEQAVLIVHPDRRVVLRCAFSPDGSQLAASTDVNFLAIEDPSGIAVIWDLQTLDKIHTISPAIDRIWGLLYSPDGTKLILGNYGIWDTGSGERLDGYQYLENQSTAAVHVFSPDGSRLFTVAADGVRVWDFESGEEQLFITSSGRIVEAALSPDGTRLITFGLDNSLRMFILDLDELGDLAKTRLTRWFTPEECQQYLHMDSCPPRP